MCFAQAMLAMDDTGALLRFVQRPNEVDLKEGEAALGARGRYSELVALYQQRGQHEAALDLLHTLTMSPHHLHIPPSGDSHFSGCGLYCFGWNPLLCLGNKSEPAAHLDHVPARHGHPFIRRPTPHCLETKCCA